MAGLVRYQFAKLLEHILALNNLFLDLVVLPYFEQEESEFFLDQSVCDLS